MLESTQRSADTDCDPACSPPPRPSLGSHSMSSSRPMPTGAGHFANLLVLRGQRPLRFYLSLFRVGLALAGCSGGLNGSLAPSAMAPTSWAHGRLFFLQNDLLGSLGLFSDFSRTIRTACLKGSLFRGNVAVPHLT